MMRKYFFVVVTILLASDAIATTPTISGVSGIISTGEMITITGSNMVDENKTNWGTAYTTGTKYGFEGTSYAGDGYADAPDSNPQDRSYDSTVKLMGNKSFKGRIYGNSSSCPTDNHSSGLYTTIASDGVGSSTDFYVRLYSRWNSSGSGSQWPTSHIKMLDVQGTGSQFYLQPSAGSSLPTQMNMVYDGTNHNYSVANFLQEDRWYAMEARFKTSAPANFTAWVDGVQLSSATPSSVGSYAYVLFNIINACGFSNLDLTNWTDGFTISTSRIYPASIIEISNSSTYGSGIVKKQAPEFLSDNSVQFKADLTGLGAGPYYLFVTNNRQEVSAARLLGEAPSSVEIVPGNLLMSESFESPISEGVRGWIDGSMADIVAGGYAGNAMRWSWAQAATQPTSSTTVRKALAADQSQLFIRTRVKFSSDWVGSGQTYHPHMLMVLSGNDYASDVYGPLANNYLNTYIEAVAGTSSPYAIAPAFFYQDQKRVSTSNGTPPVDLRAVTENRSTGYCNQPVPAGWSGLCYADTTYYSGAGILGSSPITKNEWVTLDTYIQMNTVTDGVANADGQVIQWVNGANVSSANDVMFRTNQHPAMGFRQVVLGPWIGDGSPIAQTMYIDELEVYDGYSIGARGGHFFGSLSGGGVMR